MTRLFTFGCSFTSYIWPTWADIIGNYFDEYQNWGSAGAGNYYISSRVFECNSVNNFRKDDVILIMFSQYFRNDMIDKDSVWINAGNIYNQTLYDEHFVEKYWSDEHGYFMSWYNISSVKTLLDSIGCKYKLMSAFDIVSRKDDLTNNKGRMKNCSSELAKILTTDNLFDFITNEPKYQFHNELEYHPTINSHMKWVKEYIPEFYNESMVELCKKWESLIDTNKDTTNDNFKVIIDKSKNFADFRTI